MALTLQLLGFLIIVAILNFGSCDTDCGFSRVGPYCQFNNIAYGKESRHDSNVYPMKKYSFFANDDSLSSCSYTSDRNNAAPWWNLWLPEFTTFKKLEFVTTGSHLWSFINFKVTVHNSTKSNFERKYLEDMGITCYQHNDYSPQNTKIQVTCDGSPVGNLIRIQLNSSKDQLVLCDFRLYEDCKYGFYGNGCEECSDNCYPSEYRQCDLNDGRCLYGCNPGWKGDRCETKCDSGYYGKNCSSSCSTKCDNSKRNPECNKKDGTCTYGCKAGYKGSHCDKECDDGKWGINCKNECGKCLTSPCNHVNGYCQDGCAAGYKKTWDCHTDCDDDKWGINCTNNCGKCLTSPCNHVNGYCQNGCSAGYKKTLDCHTECEDGTYGNSCLFNCSDNCKGICNRINGTCDQCRQFWTGHFCEKVSDRILSDREELTRCQETSKLNIVFICVGILWVILAVYATVITILFKRKATQNEKEETSGSFSGRTQDDAHVNETTNKTESVTYEQATEATTELARVNINATDDESHHYTDLTLDTKDEATYETIQLE